MTLWKDYGSSLTRRFKAQETALLITDVQFAFCSPIGLTGRKHANLQMQALPEKINAFVNTLRALGGLPIYLKSVPSNDVISENEKWLNDLKGISRPATKHDQELELYGLDIVKDSIILENPRDGFAHTELKAILDHRKIKNVLVCGVRTEICVRRTAERCATEGYLTFVLQDLCATRDANQAQADEALVFINAYSAVVISSAKMLQLLD